MRRLLIPVLAAGIALSGCSFGGPPERVFTAQFTRAIQVFPAVKVRVLGVAVGQVVSVKNTGQSVQVTFRVTDPGISLPADVNAAVVPMSLLGERYIQLFPAYEGGPTLRPGSTIPLSRTAVPAEPDELLRSLQDYLGQLDPKTVATFVSNAAHTLQGTGADLNRLIAHGANVFRTLSSKRDELAGLITQLNKLTVALGTRQEAIGRLIRSYNAVAGTLNGNRAALEGTISGLNSAATQLASLLVAHRDPLKADVATLTRTGRTLDRNAETLAETGHWATRLFLAASRAVDYDRAWLRLGNQGEELGALILLRLQQRLMELCEASGSPECSTSSFWSLHVPQLFCFAAVCPGGSGAPGAALARALSSIPAVNRVLTARATSNGSEDGSIQSLAEDLLTKTVGNSSMLGVTRP